MNKIRIVLIMMLCGACSSAKASLISDSTIWGHLDEIRQTVPWLQSANPAGNFALTKTYSEANVFARKDEGRFTNYYESDNGCTFGAQAASYTRLNDRIVVSGLIEYNRMTGRHMGGSFWIDPYHMPFDLVDYDVNNRGKKTLETYQLCGSASYDLTSHWTLGAEFDYTTGNYAKQKDLRHVNDLMNLSTSVGAVFTASKWDFGVNYQFRKRSEGIGFGVFGTTEEFYNTLVSYGGFWGKVEQFGGYDGYTGKTEEKPFVDRYHSGAVQVNWKPTSAIALFNELQYHSRKGYYGVPSSSKITYSRHDGTVWIYTGQFCFSGKKGKHFLRWNYDREILTNEENIYRYNSHPGGLDEIEYFGAAETVDRHTQYAGINYTGYYGSDLQAPRWVVQGGYEYASRKQKMISYPFFRKQNLHTSTIRLSGEYRLYREHDKFSFLIGTQFGTGGGTKAQDGVYVQPSSAQKPPQNVPDYLNQEFEYLTAKQMQHKAGVEYAHRVRKTRVWINGGINYSLTHAFDTQYIDRPYRHSVMLHIGCTF